MKQPDRFASAGLQVLVLCIVGRQVETGVGAEFLEFDLGLEPDVEVQDVIALDVGLFLVGCDQFCQTGMDFVRVQELAIPGVGCDCPILAGTHLLLVLVHRAGHQEMMELADKLLGQGLHHIVKDIVHAMDMVQHLDHIGNF